MAQTLVEDDVTTLPTPYAKKDWRIPELEELLDARAVTWLPIDALPLASIDRPQSRHNQARLEAIDPELVETYKAAMERGDKFPPIVIRPLGRGKKSVIVDGNHRDDALDKLKAPAHPAYLIEAEDSMIRILLIELNARHGKQLSEEEKLFHACHLKDMGASIADAASTVGLPKSRFENFYRLKQGERRAAERDLLGLWNKLGQGVRLKLLSLREDPVFQVAVFLAAEASLSANEIGALVTEVNKLRSESTKIERIQSERAVLRDRIHMTGGGKFKRTMSANARLMTVFGNFEKLDPHGVIAGVAPERRADVAKRARENAQRLLQIADELES